MTENIYESPKAESDQERVTNFPSDSLDNKAVFHQERGGPSSEPPDGKASKPYIEASLQALKNPGVSMGYLTSIGVSTVLTSLSIASAGGLELLLALNASPALILIFTIRNHYRTIQKILDEDRTI